MGCLKGRYRDRCATGLRPALDPGAYGPSPRSGMGRRMAPARPTARRSTALIKIKPLQTKSLRFQGIAISTASPFEGSVSFKEYVY